MIRFRRRIRKYLKYVSVILILSWLSFYVASYRKMVDKVGLFFVIDSEETVKIDGGGWDYIEDIEIDRTEAGKGRRAYGITITPVSVLPNAPVVTSSDLNEYIISKKRGDKTDWEYLLVAKSPLSIAGNPDLEEPARFRIEIIP